MLWRWFFAIIGMIAVGVLVWRLLQWQERRYRAKRGLPPEDDDRSMLG